LSFEDVDGNAGCDDCVAPSKLSDILEDAGKGKKGKVE
jgi:hypothetical protein